MLSVQTAGETDMRPPPRGPDSGHHEVASDEGSRAAIFYTVIASAKLNEIDPEAYMADMIDRMAKGHPINRLAELLPWNWKAVRAVSHQERRAA
jgi:hypothetical protein